MNSNSLFLFLLGKGKGRATITNNNNNNNETGFTDKVLEARSQQEQKWRLETRQRAEKERKSMIDNQPKRTFMERSENNDNNDASSSSLKSTLQEEEQQQDNLSDDDDDIWLQNEQESKEDDEVNDLIDNDDNRGKEEEEDTEEATRLLLNQLENQDRITEDLMDPVFHAIHSRFTFDSNNVDVHQAIHQVIQHLLAIKPFDQWNTIHALDLSNHCITTISNLDTLLPALDTLNVYVIQHLLILGIKHNVRKNSNNNNDKVMIKWGLFVLYV